MAKIQNTGIIQKAVIDLKLDPVIEKIPNETSDKVILTWNLQRNIEHRVLKENLVTTTASGSVLTTFSAVKRTFITGIQLTNYTTAAADNNIIRCFGTQANGMVISLIYIPKPTLTEYNIVKQINFPMPIEMKKASTFAFTNAFTVGESKTNIVLYGYELED